MMRSAVLSVVVLLGMAGSAQDAPHAQLYGAVIDSVTGMPVYEALVEWYDPTGKRQAIVQTNSEGRFALFVARDQGVELRVSENGYRPLVLALPAFEPGESAREIDLMLVPK